MQPPALTVLAQAGSAVPTQLLLLVVMGVLFYVLLIRPQQRRVREQRSLMSSIGVGDRIVTIGGIHGTVVQLDDDTLRVEISPGTVITVARAAVGRRLLDADTGDVSDDGVGPVDDNPL